MNDARVLIVGCGKVGIVAAVGLAQLGKPRSITMLSRRSPRGERLAAEFSRHGHEVKGTAACSTSPFICGTARLEAFSFDCADLSGTFDMVFLATPTTEFVHVLASLVQGGYLRQGGAIVALSSRPGSGAELSTFLDSVMESYELLVLGAYYGVTFADPERASIAHTVAVKSHVPMWRRTRQTETRRTETFLSLMRQAGIAIEEYEHPLENERRNSNIFHLSLALMPRVLERILNPQHHSFHYRYWPEGNWHPAAIESTIRLEDELNDLYVRLGLPAFNFLRFRIDRYPLPEGIISPDRIERSLELPFIERAYLYMNYLWGRQVDPFGKHDSDSHEYPDHIRATFLPRVEVTDGIGELPRIPAEDLETLSMYISLAKSLNVGCTEMETLRDNFLTALDTLPNRFGYTMNYDWQEVLKSGRTLAERIVKFSNSSGDPQHTP